VARVVAEGVQAVIPVNPLIILQKLDKEAIWGTIVRIRRPQ
jgi:hypothetical protein